jgi:hypothetical protein
MSIIGLGDSHILALAAADRELKHSKEGVSASLPAINKWNVSLTFVQDGSIARELVLDLADGRQVLNPLIMQHLVRLGIAGVYDRKPLDFDGCFAMSFGSTLSHNLGILPGLDNFRMFSPDGALLGPAAQERLPVLSRSILIDVAESVCRNYEEAIRIFSRNWPKAKRFILASPPPPRDLGKLRSDRPANGTPSKQLEVYKINQIVLRQIANRTNSTYVPAPSAVVDESGFLKEEYIDDGIHGNTAYGKLMLDSLIRAVSTA